MLYTVLQALESRKNLDITIFFFVEDNYYEKTKTIILI